MPRSPASAGKPGHPLSLPARIGRQGGKIPGKPAGKNAYEIHLVALHEHTKDILFCECKWKAKVNAPKVLAELKEKAAHVPWHNKKRKEHYALFAKTFQQKTREKRVHCYDLKDLEKAFLPPSRRKKLR